MLFVAVFTVQAQDDELASIKIDMEVDTKLFTKITENTYASDSPKAIVMAMIVPETYEDAKSKLTGSMPPDFKVTDKGEKMMNGIQVLYLEGTAESQGTTANSTVYCFKRDAETCIMFMGMLEVGADKKYEDAIATAANSVVKKQ